MDGNGCDSSHLDEDIRPPPRKRLLAGYKKQNGNEQSTSPPTPKTPTDFDARVKNLLSSIDSNGSSSLEEIAESSEKAAFAATEFAEAARAKAEEKAAVATKAIAAAKSALDLVSSFNVETSGRDQDQHTKRNKSKKQVTVHSLYKNPNEVDNEKTDETENKLVYKDSPTSPGSKNHKHKKLKVSPETIKAAFPNGKATSDNEGCSHEVAEALKNEKTSQCLTKLISSNWRMEKDIVTQKRKARKQLIHMVERQVNLS